MSRLAFLSASPPVSACHPRLQSVWMSIYRDILPGRGVTGVTEQIKGLHGSNTWAFFCMRGGQ